MTQSVVCLTERIDRAQSIEPSVRSTNGKKEKGIGSLHYLYKIENQR